MSDLTIKECFIFSGLSSFMLWACYLFVVAVYSGLSFDWGLFWAFPSIGCILFSLGWLNEGC